jgi:primase-polymerase (primpol)-like protein
MSTERSRQETASTYAAWLKERFEQKGILQELAGYPNFVLWRYKIVDGQRKKPPFNPNTHQPASPTDAHTWGNVHTVLTALATGTFQGIGFMLSHSPFSGIDLDHCIEGGSVQSWAQKIITALDTYGEYSPSWNRATGTGGVHLFVEGKPPGSKKVGNIEVYGEKHYLTITTNHLPGTPIAINNRLTELDALYTSLVPVPPSTSEIQNTGGVRQVCHSLSYRQKRHTIQCYNGSCEVTSPAMQASQAQTLC